MVGDEFDGDFGALGAPRAAADVAAEDSFDDADEWFDEVALPVQAVMTSSLAFR